MLKKILQKKLAFVAREIIAARKPEIIGISGSVGKTSTKEAIACVLRRSFPLRETYKNYNNEIGLPLTIIGAQSPGRSIFGWFKLLKEGQRIARDVQVPYPQMLVLEMGIDHPGDMDVLTSIAKPHRAVLTRLGTAHAEFFSSLQELYKEKLKLAEALSEEGIAIYNYDDEILHTAMQDLSRRSISYGFSPLANVRADNVHITTSPGVDKEIGSSFKLLYEGSSVPVFLPGVISRPGILSALAAAAVGFSYGLNAIEISTSLRDYVSPPGRMKLLAGKFDQLIIDDTYNSSPEAATESLETVALIPRNEYGHSWIVLGDMRELGAESVAAHSVLGREVADHGFDHLISVGEEAAHISLAAIKNGMPEKMVRHFENSEAALDYLDAEVAARDLVLVKGSQAVRMEKIVKRLMKEPERASELLVRQGKEWL